MRSGWSQVEKKRPLVARGIVDEFNRQTPKNIAEVVVWVVVITFQATVIFYLVAVHILGVVARVTWDVDKGVLRVPARRSVTPPRKVEALWRNQTFRVGVEILTD